MKNRGRTGPVHAAIAQLQRLADLFGERRQQLARTVGLTEQEWRVLEQIATEHFMPSMFARDRARTPAAISRVIRQLLDKQLVSVSVSTNDGRQRNYVLTVRGKRALERLRTERRRAIAAIWMDLDPRAVTAFTDFSSELARRLEVYATRQT